MRTVNILAPILCLALALAAGTGCKLNQADVGPNPARLTVVLEGKAPDLPRPAYGQWREEVRWTYDLYLVAGDGSWRKLPAQPPRREFSFVGDPIVHRTVFLAPPGKVKLKLVVHAYFHAYVGRQAMTDTLVTGEWDYRWDLPPGGSKTIKIKAP